MNFHWKKRATPWVTIAVLAGGLVSACLLLFIHEVESNFQFANAALEEARLLEIKN